MTTNEDRTTEALTFPAWVNFGGAEEAALERRRRLLEDIRSQSLQEATVSHEDPTRRHRFDAHAPGQAPTEALPPLDTPPRPRRLEDEDWVDRLHRGEGRPIGPALIALCAIAAYSLLAMGLVWLGARLLAGLLT